MKAILKSIAILAISVSISHADEYTGREKSETCLGCHAIEGYNNTYPTSVSYTHLTLPTKRIV